MPYFAGRERAKTLGAQPWGYDFMETIELLREVVVSNCSEPVVLVIHDWGAFWGFFFQMKHPELVKAVVALDVGHPGMLRSPLQSLVAFTLFGLLYQWYLAFAFLVSRLIPFGIGDRIGDLLVRSFPFSVLRLKHPQRSAVYKRLNAAMCYPYFYVYKLAWANALGLSPKVKKLVWASKQMPSCPCLFVYGSKKITNFHSTSWEKSLQEREDCLVKSLPCGHWVPLEAADKLNTVMEEWLEAQIEPELSKR